jgi:hypothetical protein
MIATRLVEHQTATLIMNNIVAPQLRRSKRKHNEQAAKPVSDTTIGAAPATRKRARKAIACVMKPSIDSMPVRSRQHDQALPPFLALPREMRDEIYKHVLNQDESSTLKSGSRNIVTRCGLVGVDSQITEEFLDAVIFYAPVITTTVRNHNFAPVVTFLNRLSEAQLTRLSTREPRTAEADDAKPKRKIRIILSYAAGAKRKDSRARLNRWLDRFDVPSKRGKEIEFEYGCDGTYRNGGYKQRPMGRASASQRWKEEERKIRNAARRGGSRLRWY